jgi:hypothetical protein
MNINDAYLGPAAEGVVVDAVAGLFPESENRFEPSFLLKTVFALDNNLPIPDFSSGPEFVGVLMMSIASLLKECCVGE